MPLHALRATAEAVQVHDAKLARLNVSPRPGLSKPSR